MLSPEETAAIAQAILTQENILDSLVASDAAAGRYEITVVAGTKDGFIAKVSGQAAPATYSKTPPAARPNYWYVELAGTKFYYQGK